MAGRIEISEQLLNAEKLAGNALATAEAKSQQLSDAGDDSWENWKFAVDIAWEDLSRSVKALIARFSCRTC
jgi:predicted component of type VI protein secretion system